METTTCMRCEDGFVVYEEDGRMVRDGCVHCGETGRVDSETNFQDLLAAACGMVGHLQALAYRDGCNADPEGDGFGLHAAENGMTQSDYLQVLAMDRADRAMGKVLGWSREAQEWLVALYDWPSRAVAAESPEATFPEASFDDVACDEDELPF